VYFGLEQLEPRLVLSGLLPADYSTVSQWWFGDLERSPAPLSTGEQPIDQSQRWIVRLSPKAVADLQSPADSDSFLNRDGIQFELIRGLGLPGQILVYTPQQDTAKVSRALSSNEYVAHFGQDGEVAVAMDPEQSFPNEATEPEIEPGTIARFQELYGLHNTGQSGGTPDADVDAPEAWHIETGSDEVVVAVIDSGIDTHHRDLVENLWTNVAERDGQPNFDDDHNGLPDDVHGWDFSPAAKSGIPEDFNGHGTHVSGTIAAEGNNELGVTGVAWNVTIMPLKFLDVNGRGILADAIAAINYATMMRLAFETNPAQGANVRVINASWISNQGDDPNLRDSIREAGKAGILFVAAAGNGNVFRLPNANNNDNPLFAAYPASYDLDNVISVTATDRHDTLVSNFNFGATTVDLAAPGLEIMSTEPGDRYGLRSGTSMAAPHVAGAAALIWSRNPKATLSEVRAALLDGVDKGTPPMAGEEATGLASLAGKVVTNGRLNVAESLMVDTIRPLAELVDGGQDLTEDDVNFIEFAVKYSDNGILNGNTSDGEDIIVRRTSGFGLDVPAKLVGDPPTNAAEFTVRYQVAGPGVDNHWNVDDNGTYEIMLRANQVFDASERRNSVEAIVLGQFEVDLLPPGHFRVSSFDDTPFSTISDVDVTLNITHPVASDLDVFLVSPEGTRVELFTGVGGAGANFTMTTLDDEATELIVNGVAPFNGPFQPKGSLAALDDEDPGGEWKLEIETGSEFTAISPNVPKDILDHSTATSQLTVTAPGTELRDLNVTLDITHTFDADLSAFLISPVGTRVELYSNVGGGQDNFGTITLDDAAEQSIVNGAAPFAGVFRPEGSLSALNGQNPNGTWTLEVRDSAGGDVGTLNSWSLSLSDDVSSRTGTLTSWSLTVDGVEPIVSQDGPLVIGDNGTFISSLVNHEADNRSLRARVQIANTTEGDNTIRVPAGTYNLTRTGTSEDNAATGDLDITPFPDDPNADNDLTIVGAGSTNHFAAEALDGGRVALSSNRDLKVNSSTPKLVNVHEDGRQMLQLGGVTLQAVNSIYLRDGRQFNLNQRTFELDGDGQLEDLNAFRVPIVPLETPEQVATRITDAINAASLPGVRAFAAEGRILLGTGVVVDPQLSGLRLGGDASRIADGDTFTIDNCCIDDVGTATTFEFDNDGEVAAGHLAISFSPTESNDGMAATISQALNAEADRLAGNTVIHAREIDRVFDVLAGVRLRLENVIVKGGMVAGDGGGIRSLGDLEVQDSVIEGNAAAELSAYDFGFATTGKGPSQATAVVVHDQQGYVVGTFAQIVEFGVNLSEATLVGFGGTDVFIIKYENIGRPLWAKRVGGIFDDNVSDVAVDSAGNVFVAGSFQDTVDFDPSPSSAFSLTSAGSDDIFVLKLNSNGEFQWAKRMGGAGSDQALGLAIDPDDNVLTTGVFEDSADFNPDPDPAAQLLFYSPSPDIFVSKLNKEGNLIWGKHVEERNGFAADAPHDIAVDDAGNIYLTGKFHNTIDFARDAGHAGIASVGGSDVFIAKLDEAGSFLWGHGYGDDVASSELEEGSAITLGPDGDVYATGVFSGDVDFDQRRGTTSFAAGGVPLDIRDVSTNESHLSVNNLSGTLIDVNVTLDISHTNDADLDVFLISPAGTRVELFTDVGDFNDNFTSTTLDDEAAVAIVDSTAPFSGSFRPEGALGALDGQDPNGEWTLDIGDDAGGDTGVLNSWSLTIQTATTTRTFANGAAPIRDNSTVLSQLTVEDFGFQLTDVDVTLDITHTFDGDLDAYLISPSGTRVELFTSVSGIEDNFSGTTLDDEASVAIDVAAAPFSGTYRPEGSLAALDYEDPRGVWTLEISDHAGGDVGVVNHWSLSLDQPRDVFQSQLPLAISDLSTTTHELPVSNLGTTIRDVNVTLDIAHTLDSNLEVVLMGPTGLEVPLFSGVGGDGDNFSGTRLDDVAPQSIDAGLAPFAGTFRPTGLLAALDGSNPNGTWRLEITDAAGGDVGTLNSWSLEIATDESVASFNVPLDIPDSATPAIAIESQLSVFDVGQLTDVDVTLDVSHTYDSDLQVFLISPAGTRVELFTNVGGGGVNFTATTLDDEAAVSIVDGTAPFSDDFRPEGLLSLLDGQNPYGTWRLEITDTAGGDVGTLNSWSLSLATDATAAVGPAAIVDRATLITPLSASGIPGRLNDVDVALDITHTIDGDLDAFLISPAGQRVELFNRIGGDGDNFVFTTLDDQAATEITAGAAPFTGSFQPQGSLSVVNGDDPNGNWFLEISDNAGGDTGTLNDWWLSLDTAGQFGTAAVPISDSATTFSQFAVSGLSGGLIDVNVNLDISNTYNSDLNAVLISPSGTRVKLFTQVGGADDNFSNTNLDDAAAVGIGDESSPYAGTFRPEGRLAAFNGENPNGIWTLEITDNAAADSGTLNNWSLELETSPFEFRRDTIFVLRLEEDGDFVWVRELNSFSTPRPSAIAVGEHNVYISGSYGGQIDLDPAPRHFRLFSQSGSEDIYVSRLDRDGDFSAGYAFGGNGADTVGGIALDNEGTLYHVGSINGQVDFDGSVGSAVFDSGLEDNAFLTKLKLPFQPLDNRGGGIFSGGRLNVSDSVIQVNQGGLFAGYSEGGGVYLQPTSGSAIEATLIDANKAFVGGGLFTTPHEGFQTAFLTISDSQIANNRSTSRGGGIANELTLTLLNSEVSGNTSSSSGGGIHTDSPQTFPLTIERSSIFQNSSRAQGGGLSVFNGDIHITNSTFSGNQTDSQGGGIADCAGITPNYTVVNSTFLDNRAVFGGGGIHTCGNATVLNTIIASNSSSSSASPDIDGSLGLVVSSGHNLVGVADPAGRFVHGDNGNLVGIDPLLEPLGVYGQGTRLHVPRPGSPLIDAGDNEGSPSIDQRGFPRSKDGVQRVDIGAAEIYLGEISGTKYHDLNGNQVPDADEVLPGWTIYLDFNLNGQLDPDEPSTVTDDFGRYVFTQLRPGRYTVAEVGRDAWRNVSPGNTVPVVKAQVVTADMASATTFDVDNDGDLDLAIARDGEETEQLPFRVPPLAGTSSATLGATGLPIGITDFATSDSTFTVAGVGESLLDLDVTLSMTHTYDGDLTAWLISPSPNSIEIELFARVGSFGRNFTNTTLDDDAVSAIQDGAAPFSGRFKPANPLSVLNGLDPNGDWTLRIRDNAFGDAGTLDAWSLTLTTATITTPDLINDFQTTVAELSVGNVGTQLLDVDVTLDIAHTYDGDLRATLVSPNSTQVNLFSYVGSFGNDFANTTLNDSAALPIQNGTAPFSGTFQPQQVLSTLNNEDPNGVWQLRIADDAGGDVGSLNSWALRLLTNGEFKSTGTSNMLAIPDNGQAITSSIGVANLSGQVSDIEVTLDVDHTRDSDLRVTLINPNNTAVKLFENVGGDGDGFNGTTFDDEAAIGITDVATVAPFPFVYRPQEPLGDVLIGQSPVGTWQLRVEDLQSGETGKLNSWSVNITVLTPGSLSIWENDGSGTFLERSTLDVGSEPGLIVSGDFDANRTQDLAVGDAASSQVHVLSNEGNFQFSDPTTVMVGIQPQSILAEDFSGDGIDDLAVTGISGNSVTFASEHANIPAVPLEIVDFTTATLEVSSVQGVLDDLDVTLNITHAWDADLIVDLVSPSGTRINLFGGIGGDGDNFIDTRLDDSATVSIFEGTPAFTGTFRPSLSLSIVNGEDPNGIWTLEITDTFPIEDDGALNSWTLAMTTIESASDVQVWESLPHYAASVDGNENVVHYWRLGDADNFIARDSIGGLDGFYQGFPFPALGALPGDPDQSLGLFNGFDFVDVTPPGYLPPLPPREISLEAWINSYSYNDFGGIVSAVHGDAGAEQGWSLHTKADGDVGFLLSTIQAPGADADGAATELVADVNLNLFEWHHIVATYDGNTMSIYVNGVPVATDNVTQAGDIFYPNGVGGGLTLGAFRDSVELSTLFGFLDEVAIYRTALTPQEVTSHFDLGQEAGHVFVKTASYRVGETPIASAAADFDGDGDQDIVVADDSSNTLSVLSERGDGSLELAQLVPILGDPQAIVARDFDRDNDVDVAVASTGNSSYFPSYVLPADIAQPAGSTIFSELVVSGVNDYLRDLHLILDVTHPSFLGGFSVALTSPTGIRVDLNLTDAGSGRFEASGPDLASVFRTPFLREPNGVWQLEIRDLTGGQTGTLNGWSLELETVAEVSFSFVESDQRIFDFPLISRMLVEDAPPSLDDVNVLLNIANMDVSFMTVELISAAGTVAHLFDPSSYLIGADFVDTRFDDQALSAISDGTAPFTGSFRPLEALSQFHGEDPNGVWTLQIFDSFGGPGQLLDWSLLLDASSTVSTGDVRTDELPSTEVPRDLLDPIPVTSRVLVDGIGDTLVDVKLRLDIDHNSAEALSAKLISPAGTRLELFSGVGGQGQNFRNTLLDDSAPTAIRDGFAPFGGAFRPDEPLATLVGENPNGLWTLELSNNNFGPAGKLLNWSLSLQAATTGGTPAEIPNSAVVTSQLRVADVAGELTDVDVQLDIAHNWDADLQVFLISPFLTRVELFEGVGEGGRNLRDTHFDDDAAISIRDAETPFDGVFRPEEPLAIFNGEDPRGFWTLEVIDNFEADAGILQDWSLRISTSPTVVGMATPTPILDEATITAELVTGNLPESLLSIIVELEISHTHNDHLDAVLISPSGTRVELFSDERGATQGFEVFFDDLAPLSIVGATGPFFGQYRPASSLSLLRGEDPNGRWTLEITDDAAGDVGTLNRWALHIESAAAVETTAVEIPLVVREREPATTQLLVRGAGETLVDVDVELDLTHTWNADVEAFLVSPEGTRVELFTGVGGFDDNFQQTTLDDEAIQSISSGQAPFTGRFRPEGDLSLFEGENPDGFWTLELGDNFPAADEGRLRNWSLTISTALNGVFVFFNDGTGVFTLSDNIHLGEAASDLIAEDLDVDGDLDLVVSLARPDTGTVLRNDGEGQFGRLVDFTVPTGIQALLGGDFDRNGQSNIGVLDPAGVFSELELSTEVHKVELAPAERRTGLHFANAPVGGTIRGEKFHDINANGRRDEGEVGLPGWTIFLDDNNDGAFNQGELFAVTDRDGQYVIEEVPPRQYVVREVLDTDFWEQTLPTPAREEMLQIDFDVVGVTGLARITATDVPKDFVDYNTLRSELTVSQVVGRLLALTVEMNITHTFDGDLQAFLTSPAGTKITLFEFVGGSGNNFGNGTSGTVFNDDAALSIREGVAPFASEFRSQDPLAAFEGEDPNGTWLLEITDHAGFDTGRLEGWSLSLEAAAFSTAGSLGHQSGHRDADAGANFSGTTFDDQALISIIQEGAVAPFQGTFRPMENLGQLSGTDPNGFWQLEIRDTAARNRGTLNWWSLSIDGSEFSARNVPVSIPDHRPGFPISALSQLFVHGLPSSMTDVNVTLDIAHSWNDDLRITLYSPLGPPVQLVAGVGGSDPEKARSFYFGVNEPEDPTFPNRGRGTLLTPLIDLTDVGGPTRLDFSSLLDIDEVKDVARVIVLHGDNREEQTTLASSSLFPQLGEQQLVEGSDFQKVSLDLTEFVGEQIQVLFDFQADTNPSGGETLRFDLTAGVEYVVHVTGFDGDTHPNYDLLITPDEPDLVVSSLNVTASDADSIQYDFTIRNDGTAAADLNNVRFQAYLSIDETQDAGDALLDLPEGSQRLSALPLGMLEPGDSFSFSKTSSGTIDALAHSFLIVKIDTGSPGSNVAEVFETNNTGADRILGDRFEANDDFANAADLGNLRTVTDLSIHAGGNADYFKFVPRASGTVDISVLLEHDLGDIDMAVLDANEVYLAGSASVTDNETVSVTVVAEQVYVIRVVGFAGATHPDYDLEIGRVSVTIAEDNFEPNNDFDNGRDLGTIDVATFPDLTLHESYNDDYYQFQPQFDRNLDISIFFDDELGDLDLAVYDASRTFLTSSTSVSDNESATVSVTAGATYYIRVNGWAGATHPDYDLVIDGVRIPPDNFEVNNSFGNAAELGLLDEDFQASGLTIHAPLDDDYYDFQVRAGFAQWATQVLDFSSQSTTDAWAANQALGPPDTFQYGDIPTAWGPEPQNGTQEFITLGYADPVHATGVVIRETYGNGFVSRVELLDTEDVLHEVWADTDPSEPGAPVDFSIEFPVTPYLVQGVKITTNTDHNPFAWEEIDAVQLLGASSVEPAAVEISIDFAHQAGNLDLFVFDANESLLELSASEDNDESVTLLATAGQDYYIKVAGALGATHGDYRLNINLPIARDAFEGNDILGDAYFLGEIGEESMVIPPPVLPRVAETGLTLHPSGNPAIPESVVSDDDFYRFRAARTGTYVFDISFDDRLGDVDLFVLDAAGEPLASSQQEGWYVDEVTVRPLGEYEVSIANGQAIRLDFGNRALRGATGVNSSGAISGEVFFDRDGDGVRDDDELPQRNVEVVLTPNDDENAREQITLTNQQGFYTFSNLGAGTYSVSTSSTGRRTFPVANQPARKSLCPEASSSGCASNKDLTSVAFADLNNDNEIDMVVADYGRKSGIEIFLSEKGNLPSTGTQVVAEIGTGAWALALDKLVSPRTEGPGPPYGASDAFPDLVVADHVTGEIHVLVNLGIGSFDPTPITFSLDSWPVASLPAGSLPEALATGDFNNDGVADIVVTTIPGAAFNGTGTVALLLNNKDGTFGAPVIHPAGTWPRQIVTGHFDEGPSLDIAVANFGPADSVGSITMLLGPATGPGNGQFQQPRTTQVHEGTGVFSLAKGDFDNDNDEDLAVVIATGKTGVKILTNDGAGNLTLSADFTDNRSTLIAVVDPIAVTADDLDEDGDFDLAVTVARGESLIVLRNNDGKFQAPGVQGQSLLQRSFPVSTAVGHLNDDDLADFAIVDGETGSITVLTNAVVAAPHVINLEGNEVRERINFGSQSFNAPPSFDLAATTVEVSEDRGQPMTRFARNFMPGGNVDAVDQTVKDYLVEVVSNPGLFRLPPDIDNLGRLTYALAENANGTAIIRVRVQDTADHSIGGDDKSAPQTFSITVLPVNDAPALTATGSSPTFTEGGVAAGLFSLTSIGLTESLDLVSTLTVTVDGLQNGASELLRVDDETIALTNGRTATTAANSYDLSVAVTAGTAAVTIGKVGGYSVSNAQSLLNALAYDNTSQEPLGTDRTVTVTSIQDTGGTSNNGVDTTAVSIGSTVTIVPVNDAPTLTATGSNPTFTEGGAPAGLYGATSIGLTETPDLVDTLTLTVAGLQNDASELLRVDGETIALTDGSTATTAAKSYDLSVSVTAGRAALTISKAGGYSVSDAQSLLNGLAYVNASQDPLGANRTVTVTSIQDTGGTSNSGDDTTGVSIGSTVTLAPVNDAPTFTLAGNVTAAENDGAQVRAGFATNIQANESGQTILDVFVSNNNTDLFSLQPEIDLTGELTFTPAENKHDVAAVFVQVQDSGGTDRNGVDTSAVQSFTITITPVDNLPPVADHQQISSPEDATSRIDLTGTDPEGKDLTFEIVSDPSHGTLSRNFPEVVYQPALNYYGPDSFTFKVKDDRFESEVATVTINVTAENDPPVPTADEAATDEDTAVEIDVLENDTDVDGDTLSVILTATESGKGANLSVTADGKIRYNPGVSEQVQQLIGAVAGNPASTETDTFNYTVRDGSVDRTATVTVLVSGINDWHNPDEGLDVNGDGVVVAIDALIVINELNALGARPLPGVVGAPPFFFDTLVDNEITPFDVLVVVNWLNQKAVEGEAFQAPLSLQLETPPAMTSQPAVAGHPAGTRGPPAVSLHLTSATTGSERNLGHPLVDHVVSQTWTWREDELLDGSQGLDDVLDALMDDVLDEFVSNALP
jgi:subtilisin-like proprotein convertase family protein